MYEPSTCYPHSAHGNIFLLCCSTLIQFVSDRPVQTYCKGISNPKSTEQYL